MTVPAFRKLIWAYYRQNRRPLPWREHLNPYRVLVSEVMLQQTQASRVAVKYRPFLRAFPNFRALARASVPEVLRLWQGLGYNRRALYLKRAAQRVAERFGGRLPKDLGALQTLPGIGRNTAGAILAYAFNLPAAFIETNIRRVYLHHFFPGRAQVDDRDILPLVERTVDRENPREWYWALMDYGAKLPKAVVNPNRRSRHYVRQERFEGSFRELRGKVLALLLATPGLTKARLAKRLLDPRLKEALSKLAREGFLEKQNRRYRLKG